MADALLQTSIQLLREENAKQSDQVIKNTATTSEGVDDLKKTMKDLLGEFRGQAGDREEARRDSGRTSPTGGVTAPERPEFDKKTGSILDLLIGIPTAVLGFAKGLATGWMKAITDTAKLIKNVISGTFKTILSGVKILLSPIAKFFAPLGKQISDLAKLASGNITKKLKDVFKPVTDFASSVVKVFKDLGTGIKSLVTDIKIGVKLYVDGFKNFVKPITNAFSNISNAFKAGMNGVKGLSQSVTGTFRSLNMFEKTFRGMGKVFTDSVKFVKSVGTSITTGFQTVIGAFRSVGQSFSNVGKFAGGIKDSFSKIVKPMKDVVAYMRNIAPGIFKAFGALGKIFGWPLTIAIGLYEGITASLSKFKSGDIIGGVFAFLTGAINGAILSVVDLLKDGISWISGMLGFENFSTFLDSFSFSEMFSEVMMNMESMIRAIPDKVTSMIEGIKEFWNGFMESEDPISYLMEPINQMITDIKEFVMGLIPSMDDIKNMASGALESVGNFFGFGGDEGATTKQQNTASTQPYSEVPVLPETSVSKQEDIPVVAKPQVKEEVEVVVKSRDAERLAYLERKLERAEARFEKTGTASAALNIDKTQAQIDKLESVSKPEPKTAEVTKLTQEVNMERPSAPIRSTRDNGLTQAQTENIKLKSEQGANAVLVNAPSSNSVTNNNNSSTAAIIDQNLPTVDQNDRSFSVA